MNNIRLLPIIFMFMFMLGACDDTFEGAGKDVEDAGENIQEATE